jgi:hypothetical protein
MGDLDNAKTHLQSALRLDPDNKNIRNFYKKIKEIEEKKEAGTHSLTSPPTHSLTSPPTYSLT